MIVEAIDCPYIIRQNGVDRDAVLGLDLGSLDAWQVTTFREVDLRSSGVPHVVMSQPTPSLQIPFDAPPSKGSTTDAVMEVNLELS